jgi:hypothetical protein
MKWVSFGVKSGVGPKLLSSTVIKYLRAKNEKIKALPGYAIYLGAGIETVWGLK